VRHLAQLCTAATIIALAAMTPIAHAALRGTPWWTAAHAGNALVTVQGDQLHLDGRIYWVYFGYCKGIPPSKPGIRPLRFQNFVCVVDVKPNRGFRRCITVSLQPASDGGFYATLRDGPGPVSLRNDAGC
jgi:hypothetical protein